nr:unnamed protein product [Digitaria exilis]
MNVPCTGCPRQNQHDYLGPTTTVAPNLQRQRDEELHKLITDALSNNPHQPGRCHHERRPTRADPAPGTPEQHPGGQVVDAAPPEICRRPRGQATPPPSKGRRHPNVQGRPGREAPRSGSSSTCSGDAGPHHRRTPPTPERAHGS